MLLAISASAEDSDLDRNRQELEKIRRRIENASRNLEEKRGEERSLAADLRLVEKELERIGRGIGELETKEARLREEIAGKTEQVERTRGEVVLLEARVKKRLTALYKSGEMGLLRIVFAAASPARMAEDHDFLGRIIRRDRDLLAGYSLRMKELEAALKEQARMRKEQEEALVSLRNERKSLKETVKLKNVLLSEVRRDRSSLDSMLQDLRDQAAALQELVKKLESGRPREYTQKSVFTGLKGILPWPVEGPLNVGFGKSRHPEFGTLYESQGIEIGIKGEQPIAAVWNGKVVFASWFKGYGNLLIVDHGEGYYTLYAQASRLTKKIGDVVEQGDVIAFSGFEGAGGVYFEIRSGSTPLDPTAWLTPR